MGVELIRWTALEIASALAYLHTINILHGDLAGGNILLTSSNKDARKFTCKVRRTSTPLPFALCNAPALPRCIKHQIFGRAPSYKTAGQPSLS